MMGLVLVLVLPALAGAIYALVIGIRAWTAANQYADEYGSTLRFVAINLCEPFVTVPWFWISSNLLLAIDESWVYILVLTAPMSMLLIPFRGFWFRDPLSRSRSMRLAGLGLLRWGNTLAMFAGFLLTNGAAGFVFVITGTIMLLWCAVYGHAALDRWLPLQTHS